MPRACGEQEGELSVSKVAHCGRIAERAQLNSASGELADLGACAVPETPDSVRSSPPELNRRPLEVAFPRGGET